MKNKWLTAFSLFALFSVGVFFGRLKPPIIVTKQVAPIEYLDQSGEELMKRLKIIADTYFKVIVDRKEFEEMKAKIALRDTWGERKKAAEKIMENQKKAIEAFRRSTKRDVELEELRFQLKKRDYWFEGFKDGVRAE